MVCFISRHGPNNPLPMEGPMLVLDAPSGRLTSGLIVPNVCSRWLLWELQKLAETSPQSFWCVVYLSFLLRRMVSWPVWFQYSNFQALHSRSLNHDCFCVYRRISGRYLCMQCSISCDIWTHYSRCWFGLTFSPTQAKPGMLIWGLSK